MKYGQIGRVCLETVTTLGTILDLVNVDVKLEGARTLSGLLFGASEENKPPILCAVKTLLFGIPRS